MLIALITIILIRIDLYVYHKFRKELKVYKNELHELQISFAKHEQEHSERSIKINRKLKDLEYKIKED